MQRGLNLVTLQKLWQLLPPLLQTTTHFLNVYHYLCASCWLSLELFAWQNIAHSKAALNCARLGSSRNPEDVT